MDLYQNTILIWQGSWQGLRLPGFPITTKFYAPPGLSAQFGQNGWPGMALLACIYFNVIFGGIGGLIGWLFYGAFADSAVGRCSGLLGGALIGGSIGYFVVSVEALRDRSLLRFCRLASCGLLLGAVGGAVGLALGDALNYALVGQLGARGGVALWGAILARGLGWMILGLNFRPIGKKFVGGVFVAVGDVNGHSTLDIIAAGSVPSARRCRRASSWRPAKSMAMATPT
jgi:hypothetical protein